MDIPSTISRLVRSSNVAAWRMLLALLSKEARSAAPLLVAGPTDVGKARMVRAALDVVFAPEPDTWATWVTSNRLADVAEAAPAPGQAVVVECDEETFGLSPWRERTAELLQRAHGSGGHGILVVSTSRVPDEALYRCLPRL